MGLLTPDSIVTLSNISVPGMSIRDLSWDPASTRIGINSTNNRSTLYDFESGQIVVCDEIPDHLRAADTILGSVAWAPSGMEIAIGETSSIHLIDRQKRECSRTIALAVYEALPGFPTIPTIWGMSWSPDGAYLSACYNSLDQLSDVQEHRQFIQLWATTTWDSQEPEQIAHLTHYRKSRSFQHLWRVGRPGLWCATDHGFRSIPLPGFPNNDLKSAIRAFLPTNETFESIAESPTGSYRAFATQDHAILIAQSTKEQTRRLEGHTSGIAYLGFSQHEELLFSCDTSGVANIWRCKDWQLLLTTTLPFPSQLVSAALHPSKPLLAIASGDQLFLFQYSTSGLDSRQPFTPTVQYTNAKVVLIGDTGVGKSGLGLVLSGQSYKATDSTHGRNVWLFERSQESRAEGGTIIREAYLWDLAGQPGYRLTHQLHLHDVAAACFVIDAKSETDPLAGIGYWCKALAQTSKLDNTTGRPVKKVLVSARIDRGGLALSKERIAEVVRQWGFAAFVETKQN